MSGMHQGAGNKQVEMTPTTGGDGLVPTQRAILPGADIRLVHQTHNQLYVNEDVFRYLRYELV
ncbi:MAG: hypothetical protein AAF485_20200 [Chloroflexota bacterium]